MSALDFTAVTQTQIVSTQAEVIVVNAKSATVAMAHPAKTLMNVVRVVAVTQIPLAPIRMEVIPVNVKLVSLEMV